MVFSGQPGGLCRYAYLGFASTCTKIRHYALQIVMSDSTHFVYINVLQRNINRHDVVFYKRSKKELHFGERHPILVDSHGSAGSPARAFPGFGGPRRKDWSRVERLRLMWLLGVLSIASHNDRLKELQLNLDENDPSRVVRMRGASSLRRNI
jgi:hypothetical protein